MLDKIAVTANEHFTSGLAPARVEYSRYWRDARTGQIRPQLGSGGEGPRCLLALAELAGDLSEDGMYPNARLLRNAGTHRLVHATTGEPTGPTQDTFSTVNMPELQTSTVEALQVSGAAYLYFVDQWAYGRPPLTRSGVLSPRWRRRGLPARSVPSQSPAAGPLQGAAGSGRPGRCRESVP